LSEKREGPIIEVQFSGLIPYGRGGGPISWRAEKFAVEFRGRGERGGMFVDPRNEAKRNINTSLKWGGVGFRFGHHGNPGEGGGEK